MRDAAKAALAALTARERTVARLYAEGLSRKAVARRLGIAPGTVRSHLDAIFRKLRVHSRLALHRLLGGDARPAPARVPFVPVAAGAPVSFEQAAEDRLEALLRGLVALCRELAPSAGVPGGADERFPPAHVRLRPALAGAAPDAPARGLHVLCLQGCEATAGDDPVAVLVLLAADVPREAVAGVPERWRAVPSLRHLLPVGTTDASVRHWRRRADGWQVREIAPGEVLTLEDPPLRIRLAIRHDS